MASKKELLSPCCGVRVEKLYGSFSGPQHPDFADYVIWVCPACGKEWGATLDEAVDRIEQAEQENSAKKEN